MKNKNNKKIFTPNVTKQALAIMNKILIRPCAKPFINFFPDVDIEKLEIEPICLSLIIEKLKNRKYKTPTEWYHDMKLINTNCSIIFPDDKNYAILSNQLFIIFEKEFELFVSYSSSKWTKLVGMLSHRLVFKSLKHPPKSYLIPTEINAVLLQNYPYIPDYSVLPNKSNEILNPKAVESNFYTNFSDSDEEYAPIQIFTKEEKEHHEQSCFLSAISALKSRDDAKTMVEIIAKEQPNINIEEPNPVIDFNDLDKSTIRRLIEFTKRRYIELGLNYPK